MFRTVWIVVICGALLSCATVQTAPEQARLAVQQASDQFWATREHGDAAAFAAQFTEDGIFMVPGLEDAVGRSAIEELAKVRFSAVRVSDFKVHRREIEVAGDTAHELGWYSETSRANESAHRMRGRYLLDWRRGSDGIWRVHRYLYSFSGAQPLP